MYGPGTRRPIKNPFRAGATVEEIMEVLKVCVIQGVQSCNFGVPILAEELERSAASQEGVSDESQPLQPYARCLNVSHMFEEKIVSARRDRVDCGMLSHKAVFITL